MQCDMACQKTCQRIFLRQQFTPCPIKVTAAAQAAKPEVTGLNDGIPKRPREGLVLLGPEGADQRIADIVKHTRYRDKLVFYVRISGKTRGIVALCFPTAVHEVDCGDDAPIACNHLHLRPGKVDLCAILQAAGIHFEILLLGDS